MGQVFASFMKMFCINATIMNTAMQTRDVDDSFKHKIFELPDNEVLLFTRDNTSLYKQKRTEDGNFLSSQLTCEEGSLYIVHIKSRQELRIIITDKEFGLVCCNHVISHDFNFIADGDSSDFSWCGQSSNSIVAMHIHFVDKTDIARVVTAITEAKKIATEYKEQQEAVKQLCIRQAVSTIQDEDESQNLVDEDEHQSENPTVNNKNQNVAQNVTEVKRLTQFMQKLKIDAIVKDEIIKIITADVEEYEKKVQDLQTKILKKDDEINQLKAQVKEFKKEKNETQLIAQSEENEFSLDSVKLIAFEPDVNVNNYVYDWEAQLQRQGVPKSLWVSAVGKKALPSFQRTMFLEGKFDTDDWGAFILSIRGSQMSEWNE